MILELISSVFTGIGFAVALTGIVRGSFTLNDKIKASRKRKREREDQVLALLNRIDNRLTNLKS